MASKSLNQHIEEMKSMADTLVPHSYPIVSMEDEEDVLYLKHKVINVDGYVVKLLFSKSDFSDYSMELLQIESVHVTFLPFNLVCKLGKAFLGDKGLAFSSFNRSKSKVYCWIFLSRNGFPLISDGNNLGNYEGFEFYLFDKDSVELSEFTDD